jgi:hypothetical protein
MRYTNHGPALAGPVVSEATGIPYAEYMQYNVLDHLQVRNSGFELTANQAGDLAQVYVFENGELHRVPYRFWNRVPASALHTTAKDMTHFMIALVSGGRYKRNDLLSSETVESMWSECVRNHSALLGVCSSFFEGNRNGHRSLSHGGSIPGFQTIMYLWPQLKLGISISSNSSSVDLNRAVLDAFIDHSNWLMRTAEGMVQRLPSKTITDAASVVGRHRYLRSENSGYLKSDIIFSNPAVVESLDDRTLSIAGLVGEASESRKFRELDPFVFQELHADRGRISFEAGKAGKSKYLFADGPRSYYRIPWYAAGWLHIGIGVIFLLVYSLSVLFYVVRPSNRGHQASSARSKGWSVNTITVHDAARLTIVVGVVILVSYCGPRTYFLVIEHLIPGMATDFLPPYAYKSPMLVTMISGLPVVNVGLTLILIAVVFVVCLRRSGPRLVRAVVSTLASTEVAVVAVQMYWFV